MNALASLRGIDRYTSHLRRWRTAWGMLLEMSTKMNTFDVDAAMRAVRREGQGLWERATREALLRMSDG